MKLQTAIAGLVLAAVSCTACQTQTKSRIPMSRRFEFIGLPEQNIDRDCAQAENKFYVSFELVVHVEQVEKHMITMMGLCRAIEEWTKHLPISVVVYFDDIRTYQPGDPSVMDRYGVIEVVMDDIQSAPYELSSDLLGLWWPDGQVVLLDVDMLDKNPKMAYAVALHELGHVFGVPHIVNMDEPAITGSIVLPPDEDAEKYVMYPNCPKDKSRRELSEMEISIARHNVQHWWTNTSKIGECYLTTGQ